MPIVQYSSAYNFNGGAVIARTDTSFTYKRANDDMWRSARVDIVDLTAGHLYGITVNVDKTNKDLNLLVIGTTEDDSTGKNFGTGHFTSSTSYTIEVTPTGNKLTLDFMQGGIKSNFVTFTFSDFEVVDLTMSQLRENLNLIKTQLNNAKEIVDSILSNTPVSSYIELEYIESTGTQYINTLYTPNQDTKIELGVSNVSGATNGEGGLIGAYNTWITNSYLLFISQNAIRWAYTLETVLTTDITAYHNIELYRGSCKVDNSIISSDLGSTTTKMDTVLTIFKGGSKLTNMKLYYLKIYENDILVRNLIPVKRKSDNVICMYDKVTNTFFENQGTGEFIAGGEV